MPDFCPCEYLDPILCNMSTGSPVVKSCPCICHAVPRDEGKAVKIASAVGDIDYNEEWPKGDLEC